jgi:hypothetical protein
MRLATALTLASLFALAACPEPEPNGPNTTLAAVACPNASALAGERRTLEDVKARLAGAATPEAYIAVLLSSDTSLAEIGARTAQPPPTPTQLKLACHMVSADAAMVRAFLPADRRTGDALAPANDAGTQARAAVDACDIIPSADRTATEERHCALARLFAAAAPAQTASAAALLALPGDGEDAASIGWEDLRNHYRALQDGASSWTEITSALAGTDAEDVEAEIDYREEYLQVPACMAFDRGRALTFLMSDIAPGAALDDAAAFGRVYDSAMAAATTGLSLAPDAESTRVCRDRDGSEAAVARACSVALAPLETTCGPLLRRRAG